MGPFLGLKWASRTLSSSFLSSSAAYLRPPFNCVFLGMMKEEEEQWQIIHIPGKPPFPPDQQPTVNVYASFIEPKVANTLVRHLCKLAPLEDLRHVKRVRKKTLEDGGKTQLTVILCLAHEPGYQLNDLPQQVQELVGSYQLSPFITKVCKYAATSKEEWEEQCKLWPTSYHPPTYNIDGIAGFSDKDSLSICNFMKHAIELAISGDKPLVNAAVIVDPSVRQVIATATDQVHSLCTGGNNSSGETIYFKELRASTHSQCSNGMASDSAATCLTSSPYKPKQSYSTVACLNAWHWALQQMHIEGSCRWHPLQHAAMVAIESSAARDRHLFPSPAHNGEVDQLQSSIDSPAKRQKTNFASQNIHSHDGHDAQLEDIHTLMGRPYLCTGYDIYLLFEPCTMCAMALVHQRVKRIFYAFPNPSAGALGSVHRLQGEKRLNHHYAVFRVMLPEEILGLHTNRLLTTKTEQNGKCKLCD